MAANFWISSHCNHWLLDKNRVRQAYARDRDTFSEIEIRKLHIHYAQYIQQLGKNLKMRQRLVATAIVYFKRFYIKNSLLHYDPRLIAPTALYLASKVEECPLQAKLVCIKLKNMDPSYPYTVSDLLECEFFMLEEMNFYLLVYHAYRPLMQFLSEPSSPKEIRDLLKYAWYLVNDSYRTDLSLLYPPYMIALACIFMAAVFREVDVLPWFHDLNVDAKEVADIAEDLHKLYEPQLKTDSKELELIKTKFPHYEHKTSDSS